MSNVPDIDLDFPRSIREDLILRTHQKWGWQQAALTGTIATYMVKGAVRDLGQALGLPEEEVDQLAKQVDWGSARQLESQMQKALSSRTRPKPRFGATWCGWRRNWTASPNIWDSTPEA